MNHTPIKNEDIAAALERIADLLEAQDDNPFRVRAYRQGAETIRTTDRSMADYVRADRLDDLTALPNIGNRIAALIGEYVTTGKIGLLENLETQASPETMLMKVPGIGTELANRIVAQLGIQTLTGLEEAAYSGRLAEVEGFGERRVEGVRAALAGMLSTSARRRQRERTAPQDGDRRANRPSVALLLEIDAEYRRRAEADDLRKIAPRRFNPDGEAWLPVLHTEREGWEFTALYSNTAQAHRIEKTDDWVVIYYERDHQENQNTVVTETQGPLEGQRVVRGRGAENLRHYAQATATT